VGALEVVMFVSWEAGRTTGPESVFPPIFEFRKPSAIASIALLRRTARAVFNLLSIMRGAESSIPIAQSGHSVLCLLLRSSAAAFVFVDIRVYVP
jgi:hypothetical protein